MFTQCGWRSDHFTTIMSIRCWTFLPYTRARVALPLSLYMRCSRICRIITDLQKKTHTWNRSVYVWQSQQSHLLPVHFFSSFLFLILQFDIPSWCFMAFYSFLSFFFDLLFAGVFHSHRVDVDVNKSRIETREKKWKEVEKRVNTFL